MTENPYKANQKYKAKTRPPMEINLDRPNRLRSLIVFTICLLTVATVFAWLLTRFTGSRLIGFGLAFGMLAYMLLMAKWTARNLRGPDQ